ncbi:DUF3606 domain-containing protein [candidate division NPL-UPA2 bacterium]|nr:DUF3606 domain-containing protein [candidate division NPL-UPA2 bacterium]
MAVDDIKLLKERVNLRTLLVALIIAVFGISLLYLSAHKDWWKGYEIWQTVVQNVGGLLLVTVAITLLWELWGKRAFLDEVLAKAQLSRDITFAGIVKITDSFHHDIDWKSYFRTVNKLDIFFAYARTWRNTHVQELQEVAARENARIRVVLPDPEDDQTVHELARRFNYTPEELRNLIKEAETHFRNLRSSTSVSGAQIDIWFLPAAPHFTFYRFDRIGILALYSHRRERAPVPTFICEMGGTLYDYIRKEFEAMIRPDGLARLITGEEK